MGPKSRSGRLDLPNSDDVVCKADWILLIVSPHFFGSLMGWVEELPDLSDIIKL